MLLAQCRFQGLGIADEIFFSNIFYGKINRNNFIKQQLKTVTA